MTPFSSLDLFSGIGGFALGLERAGIGTAAFCEINPEPCKTLAKHWPEVPIYHDVRDITAARLTADGITANFVTGGFPCQDISLSGKLAGIGEGTRSGLWSECLRIVSDFLPDYAIFENVRNLLAGPSDRPGGWFARILSDLASIGYDAEWFNIPACYVGAWHKRARVWILAYPKRKLDGQGREQGSILRQSDLSRKLTGIFAQWPGRSNLSQPTLNRKSNGVSAELVSHGNAVIPQIPELIGRAIMDFEQRKLAEQVIWK